jgi:hypothetical protein
VFPNYFQIDFLIVDDPVNDSLYMSGVSIFQIRNVDLKFQETRLAAFLRKKHCLRGFNAPLNPKPLRGASFGLGGFFFAIFRGRAGLERMQKTGRDAGNLIDRSLERSFVGFRGFIESSDLPHELQRSCSDLFVTDGRIEVKESLDIPAHNRRDLRSQNSEPSKNDSLP